MLQPSQPTPDLTGQRLMEAARYALLRRMAFALRHQMVVHLQPIGMITEVIDRRLRQPQPDLAQVQQGMARINGFSRAAVQACLDAVTWLAPEAGSLAMLDAGVAECVGQLRSSFSFRGFALHNTVAGAPVPISRAALRTVLPACLLALTDEAAAPADVVVAMEPRAGLAVLTIDVRATAGPAGFQGDTPYRALQWHEVEALAQDEHVEISREGRKARLVLREQPTPT